MRACENAQRDRFVVKSSRWPGSRPWRRAVLVISLALLGVPTAWGAGAAQAAGEAAAAGNAPQLHVQGNRLVDQGGAPVVLRGVDRSGGEFSCVQGHGIWNGPMDQASVTAMKSWGITAVRIPLNEACWNAERYVSHAYSGPAYRDSVEAYVRLLGANGIVAVLDLHWTDGAYTGNGTVCPSAQATCEKPMPDAGQAVPFWTSVATAFKGNNSVIFDLFNEPFPDRAVGSEAAGWQCWLRGGSCPGIGYRVAGMQSLVSAVRSTGATNVLMLAGLGYANGLTGWLAHEPADPDHNLVASWHSYNFNDCASVTCWDSQIAPVTAAVPVIAGEIGENDCSDSYVSSLMSWLDARRTSYFAWTWNNWDCGSGDTLISNYAGQPTAYGAGYREHLLGLTAAAGCTADVPCWLPYRGGATAVPGGS